MDITDGVDMRIEIKEGFKFNGFDTTENDMYLIDRSAPTPQEKEIIESVPFAHGVYDFSNILGERIFENRPISYTFHIYEHDYDRRKHEQTVLENKLLGTHITRLEDSYDENYYYLGKCTSINTTDDHEYNRLIVVVEFDCYPFKISKLPEGHDIWDDVNFELDVLQDTIFHVDKKPFVPLQIGSMATLTAWATNYYGGSPISRQLVGESARITDITYEGSSVSNISYKLQGIDGWVLEQDIVQAQGDGTEICLYNNGSTSLVPIIETTYPVSILFKNNVFNAWLGSGTSDLFRLSVGENKMRIYTLRTAEVGFTFHKELI